MENIILKKEDIIMMSVTEENTRFLEENNLRIKGHISYECVLSGNVSALGKIQSVTLQGKPGGTLANLMFAKVNFGTSSEGRKLTPFGVIFFEEEEGK